MATFRAAMALALVFIVSPAAAWADVIAPRGASFLEGNTSNSFPFGHSELSMRYQQVFDASEFDSATTVTGLRFRPDALDGAFSLTLPHIVIRLSTTAHGADALSTDLDDNVGSDATTVASGPLVLSSAFRGPPDGPKDFDILIGFGESFDYDPALGNLLLEVVNGANVVTALLDAEDSIDGVSRAYTIDADGPTIAVDTLGLVTRFVTTPAPVPEPGAWLLTGCGVLGIAGLRRRRARFMPTAPAPSRTAGWRGYNR